MTSLPEIQPFKIIGISVRTTNADGQAVADLGHLWGRFYGEQISTKIPNKAGDDVYVVYTDYELDHEGSYTTIIGCQVTSADTIPPGMTVKEIGEGPYKRFTAKGKMPHAVIRQWQEIWNSPGLQRRYTTDYEVYGKRCRDEAIPEVDIYIATK